MLIFLLVIIAIGVLLASDAGQELLGGIFFLAICAAIVAIIGVAILFLLALIGIL